MLMVALTIAFGISQDQVIGHSLVGGIDPWA
jgi:hypothetical protein